MTNKTFLDVLVRDNDGFINVSNVIDQLNNREELTQYIETENFLNEVRNFGDCIKKENRAIWMAWCVFMVLIVDKLPRYFTSAHRLISFIPEETMRDIYEIKRYRIEIHGIQVICD